MLGGTLEATRLCQRLAEAGLRGTVSMAGRVANPAAQALPLRIGGFGGAEGLARYLAEARISHVIDATHPFAAQMSAHAVAACDARAVPLIALTRARWQQTAADRWTRVSDIAGAVAALDTPATRVMLAVGRMHLPAFTVNPQHFYLLRLVDPPKTPPPFAEYHVVVDRGPFTPDGDRALMQDHGIDLVVSKNAGGSGASAKLDAARTLNIPVLMIDRPALPDRREVATPAEVLDWLAHAGADLGV